MANFRITIACWQNRLNHHTAVTIQPCQQDAVVAVADSAARAVRQVRECVKWMVDRGEWYTEGELIEPSVQRLRVSMRTRSAPSDYQPVRQELPARTMPASPRSPWLPYAVELTLPMVVGRVSQYMWLGVIPELELDFLCNTKPELFQTAEEQVRATLVNATLEQIVPFLDQREVHLEDVSIPVRNKRPRAFTAGEPQVLAEVAVPLGKSIRQEPPPAVFQRDREIQDLVHRLTRRSAPLLLLGNEGIGKSVILAAAARSATRLIREESDSGGPHRFWATSAGRIIAGMQYLGQWEARCESLIAELNQVDGCLIVDSLLDLIRTGGADPRGSIAAFLLPYLRAGQLAMICEATPAQVIAANRLLPEFVEAFSTYSIAPMDSTNTRAAARQCAALVTSQTKVEFAEGCVEKLLQLVERYEPYRVPLGVAATFVRQMAVRAKKQAVPQLGVDDIIEQYAVRTGLPLDILLDDVRLEHDTIVQELRREVVGQDRACDEVASVVTMLKAGLNAPTRPIGVMLFCGPTGVGKTQLAKSLSRYLFGHAGARSFVRLDMSEYSGPTAADRLLCKPDRTPSSWIEQVRARPFCVLLLDEIEKADWQVFDLFMGLLDEGRLTDTYGRTTNFNSSIVIMTSNLGVDKTQAIGFGDSEAARFEASVRAFFRPEFFNRIDAVIPFDRLSRDVCRQIVQMELAALAMREGVASRHLTLQLDDRIVDRLLEKGFDETLGARPLQRSLEQEVTAPLARYLARHPQVHDDCLRLEMDDDRVTIVKA